MPKRGENIHKRKDGRWEARYRTGVDPTGRITYGSVYAKTYREAKARQAEKVNEFARKLPINRANPLFVEVADLWMENNRLRLRGSTDCRYRNLLETHIIPDIQTETEIHSGDHLRLGNEEFIFSFDAETPQNGKRVCPRCANPVVSDARFCNNCGQKL